VGAVRNIDSMKVAEGNRGDIWIHNLKGEIVGSICGCCIQFSYRNISWPIDQKIGNNVPCSWSTGMIRQIDHTYIDHTHILQEDSKTRGISHRQIIELDIPCILNKEACFETADHTIPKRKIGNISDAQADGSWTAHTLNGTSSAV